MSKAVKIKERFYTNLSSLWLTVYGPDHAASVGLVWLESRNRVVYEWRRLALVSIGGDPCLVYDDDGDDDDEDQVLIEQL